MCSRWECGGGIVPGVLRYRSRRLSDGSPNVVDLIRAGKVDMIINTPRSKQGRRDGYEIRRADVDFGVPYITMTQAAIAAADAVAAGRGIEVAAVRGTMRGKR